MRYAYRVLSREGNLSPIQKKLYIMKLHLPVALLTAVISAVAYGNEQLYTIESSTGKDIDWSKLTGYNAIEIKDSEFDFGTLSKAFEKVSAERSTLSGKFEDGEVQLYADNSSLTISDGLTTTLYSSITNKSTITVSGNAAFKGTSVENSTINVTGNIDFNTDSLEIDEDTYQSVKSSVTSSNLTATGDMSFTLTTMNGGTISVGGTLSLGGSTIVVDSINNGEAVKLSSDPEYISMDGDIDLNEWFGSLGGSSDLGDIIQSGSAHHEPTSLTVNSALKLAADSHFEGYEDSKATLVATAITTDGAVTFDKADVTATEGDITLSGSKVTDSSITAAGDMHIQKDSSVSNSHLEATNIAFYEGATMDGGSIDGSASIAETAQVTIDELYAGSELVNKGQLTVGTADFSNTSVVNAGQMEVTKGLTLQNTALTLHMDGSLNGDTISGNSSAIKLNSLDNLILTTDSISLVTFVVTLDGLTNGTYDLSLDLFTLAVPDSDGESMWQSALAGDKVCIRLVDASNNSVDYRLNNMTVTTGNSVTVTGSLTIPEPTTATLSLLALAALAARRRRK